jgi:hypothetical protein
MAFQGIFGASSLSIAVLAGLVSVAGTAHANDFSFNVHNSTDTRITKILVSENRKSWGQFNIGRGIQPGATVKLVWDKSTNNEACAQWVKAVFADNTEAKPAKFDFCEDDLEIEF